VGTSSIAGARAPLRRRRVPTAVGARAMTGVSF